MPLTTAPTITQTVDQRLLVVPLSGPGDVGSYLDRFPEEIYSHSLDSRLVRLVYTLLGPAGAGWVRKQYLLARLQMEEQGLDTFDLDAFYANPLQFSRAADEVYDDDPSGLLDRASWERIRARDASYRSRVLDFLVGCNLGNSPEGIHLVARSGLGHEVEVVENYRYLYDSHSDDPLGLPYEGRTLSTEEFVVLPRQELSATEVQRVTILGEPDGGVLALDLDGQLSSEFPFDATSDVVEDLLEALPNIGTGNVEVGGGPGPGYPWDVRFAGSLSGRSVSQLSVDAALTGGTNPYVDVTTIQGGVDASDEILYIPDRDVRHLQDALDRVRPVASIPTVGSAPGLRTRVDWRSVSGTGQFTEVVRYVTGTTSVAWPSLDGTHWIEPGREHEAPRGHKDQTQHYQGFHDVAAVHAYVDAALDESGYQDDPASVWDEPEFRSEHVGNFGPIQRTLFPDVVDPGVVQYTADRSLADYAEPLLVTNVLATDPPRALVNGVYPTDYQALPGVPALRYKEDQFWASVERAEGVEYLEVDLGRTQAINYLAFEVTRKPVTIAVDVDVLDLYPGRDFRPLVVAGTTSVSLGTDGQNPWQAVELTLEDPAGNVPLARNVRIGIARVAEGPLSGGPNPQPWSVEVRNLRIGRNVT